MSDTKGHYAGTGFGGHCEETEILMFLRDHGYVRDLDAVNPDNAKHQWLLHGNDDWFVDDRWTLSMIRSHHAMYIALMHMERGHPESYRALMADIEGGAR